MRDCPHLFSRHYLIPRKRTACGELNISIFKISIMSYTFILILYTKERLSKAIGLPVPFLDMNITSH